MADAPEPARTLPLIREAPVRLVQVAVSLPVDGPFTYKVPRDMELELGHAVLVPFGPRRVAGYVVGFTDQAPGARIKEVARLLDHTPAFDATQLRFFRWASRYYLSGLGEVIATALPSAYRARTLLAHEATPEGIEALASSTIEEGPLAQVFREVVARPGRTRNSLQKALHGELEPEVVLKTLDLLVRQGLVKSEQREVARPQAKVRTVKLAVDPTTLPSVGGARMRGVLTRLVEAGGALDLATLLELEGTGARDAVKRLEQRGLVQQGEREDRRSVVTGELSEGDKPTPTLNAEQVAAVEAISSEPARPWLLHGVTGSGKTEVYLHAAARVLERDQQVLILVPEIALTPQLTGRVKERFGEAVAVLHSGLTPVERLREWRRIRAGEATVAVGARSALFSPFKDLGLVVVDEEHDDSYKQDDGVRYHARDLAVVRGHLAGCPVVLGSATPSLESWSNARDHRYGLLRLADRATPRAVPSIELVDMRGRPGSQALAPELVDAIRSTLGAGGKAIVLYNRRGYAPVVECPGCGGHYACPSCGVGMVYHRRAKRIDCHYCGFHRPFEDNCPACGDALQVLGHGTERIEEALAEAFPEAGILRMDADTTQGRGSHHEILERFRGPEAQLLVGTQLVAKGHDFPDVHLAAVVGVDHILMMPDFRSAERTFSLVTQLAGRAGRGDVAGKVLVQTRHSDHFVFRLLAGRPLDDDAFEDQDIDPLDAFYVREAHQRHVLRYPPFSRLVLLKVEGASRDATQARAAELARELRRAVGSDRDHLDVLGPVAAPMSRLVGRWRFQIVVRGRHSGRLRQWLEARREELRKATRSGVRVILDVDPRSLL